jgi:hypothetical protein
MFQHITMLLCTLMGASRLVIVLNNSPTHTHRFDHCRPRNAATLESAMYAIPAAVRIDASVFLQGFDMAMTAVTKMISSRPDGVEQVQAYVELLTLGTAVGRVSSEVAKQHHTPSLFQLQYMVDRRIITHNHAVACQSWAADKIVTTVINTFRPGVLVKRCLQLIVHNRSGIMLC